MAKLVTSFASHCSERSTLDEVSVLKHDGELGPFDPDSPYWVVPNAFALARALDLDESEVLAIVSA